MRSKVAQRILAETPEETKIFARLYADIVVRVNQLLKENKLSQKDLADKMVKRPSVYDPTNLPHYPIAKEMSLIAVDEIINIVKKYETEKGRLLIDNIKLEYWNEVKHEIEKL